jgi:hypothetical protein
MVLGVTRRELRVIREVRVMLTGVSYCAEVDFNRRRMSAEARIGGNFSMICRRLEQGCALFAPRGGDN